ncbi:hypothetical protein PYW08_005608 [Mythimna loreyi]|uniref:Uncharacterized protein n=1 Tax=Mythimna loreyi TaxID=667449 RepID=A0ACC2QH49_9NEOP|nr:hypothetical protein PYW08_005608 [Mythimna loreyi]
MASLLLRKTLCLNQMRTLHRSAVACSVLNSYNIQSQSRRDFDKVLPEVIDTLLASPKLTKQLPEVRSWVEKLVNYTMDGGKHGKGMTVPFAYQKLEDPKYFSEEKLHSAQFFGWCLEMSLGCLTAMDDIIDSSKTRRGQTCWYLRPEVGTSAINDCFLVHHCFMEAVEMKFGNDPIYPDLAKLINEALLYTSIGQNLEYLLKYSKERNNLDKFTMESIEAIAIHKTFHFSLRYPLLAALLLVKNGKEIDTTELMSIGLELSKILQFQNDHKDIYWNQASSGKVGGEDIQGGKCTWFAVTALQRCNEAQRAIFKEYYGSKDPEHVKRIKQLYDELEIDKVYEKFRNSTYENLEHRIRKLPRKGETELFLEIMEAMRMQIF